MSQFPASKNTGGALALLAGLCLLGGCVTSGVDETSAPPPSAPPAVAAKRTARACVDEVASKPDYEPLRAKLALGTDDRGNGPHLANRDRPAVPEMALLDAMNADLGDCRKIARAEAPPARVAKLAELHTAAEKLWARVLQDVSPGASSISGAGPSTRKSRRS